MAVLINLNVFKKTPFIPGLDIAGGVRVVLQADPQRPEDWPKEPEKQREKMETIRETIEKRVKGLGGVSESRVYRQGQNRLIVELPGVNDKEEALDVINQTASLEFYYLKDIRNSNNPIGAWDMRKAESSTDQESWDFVGPDNVTINNLKDPKAVLEKVVDVSRNRPVVTGKDILSNAKAGLNQQGQVVVNIEFNNDGTKTFREFTRDHVGDILAIFFDGKLLTAPTIQTAIGDGRAQITGFGDLRKARLMAQSLNAGALPVPLKIIAKDTVEPTLGQETINKVIFAGVAGLLLVVVFMCAYYRLPGVIACIALGLYTLFTMAFFRLIHASMSLAGVAALIISIGMAVDANILIFERLKEELRSGKTLKAAIDTGFGRAFTAIFDSNMCTAITCCILMYFGSPAVQSFAITLLVGVAISMFTAITVTRTILHLLVSWEWAQQPGLYGLGTSWMSNVKWNIVAKRNYFFLLSAILIVPGLIAMGINFHNNGTFLKEGIEFKSGTSLQATFKQPVQHADILAVVQQHSKDAEVQMGSSGTVAYIKTKPLDETKLHEETSLLNDLNSKFGIKTLDARNNPKFDAVSSVEPTISTELKRNAFWSVIAASVLIILYLSIRFAIGGFLAGVKFGVCAVIALIHDALFILGLFAMLGFTLGWEIDSLFVTAVLTIIGFSVHDTIVVFDRIRENLRHRERGESFETLANKSIIQTLSRSINTSFTVVLTLAMLIVFGGPLLKHFYIALLAGIIIGTYSSIFNATPLVIVWEKMAAAAGSEPRKKEFEDKALVEKPMVSAVSTPEPEAVESNGSDDSQADKSGRIKKKPTTAKKRRF